MKGSPTLNSIRRHLLIGLAAAALCAGGVGGWASTTQIAGAIVATGTLVVDSNVKKVQHPTGGVVADLRVREGDQVKAGDLLVRLDATIARANLGVIVDTLDELTARQARLQAERDGQDRFEFPPELLAKVSDPRLSRLLAEEESFFEVRRTARDGQKAQLQERIRQLNEQIGGMKEQVGSKNREIGFIQQELEGVRELWRKNLVQMTRLTSLQRDAARLEGERGALLASVAQATAKITETNLQIIQIDQDLRTEVGKEISDVRAKISELLDKRIAAQDQLQRVEILAPQSGRVHQLNVHTIGGVITPSDPIMLIVPANDSLTVEARIAPRDIDQVHMGQLTLLRFSAFNQRTTPEINGEVSLVSPDISTDQKSGMSYYILRISIPNAEIGRLQNISLKPGMPVEAFIQTGERTVMGYLTKPLYDQVAKAWRER
jgi:HlyD family secretion protein